MPHNPNLQHPAMKQAAMRPAAATVSPDAQRVLVLALTVCNETAAEFGYPIDASVSRRERRSDSWQWCLVAAAAVAMYMLRFCVGGRREGTPLGPPFGPWLCTTYPRLTLPPARLPRLLVLPGRTCVLPC